MQIAIDLPGDFVAFQGEQSIRREIKLSYALWLYQTERVTLSKAAELAGLDIYDFMTECKNSRIPVIAVERGALIVLPVATASTASANWSGALSLVRYPEAPARIRRTAYCSGGYMLRISTGSRHPS